MSSVRRSKRIASLAQLSTEDPAEKKIKVPGDKHALVKKAATDFAQRIYATVKFENALLCRSYNVVYLCFSGETVLDALIKVTKTAGQYCVASCVGSLVADTYFCKALTDDQIKFVMRGDVVLLPIFHESECALAFLFYDPEVSDGWENSSSSFRGTFKRFTFNKMFY